VALGRGIVQFEGLSFHPEGDAGLTVYLAIREKDDTVHEETSSYTRVPPGRK
jgi:hypothetical protein